MRFIIAKQRYTILKHNTPSQAKQTTNPPKKATAPGYWNQTLLLTSQKNMRPFVRDYADYYGVSEAWSISVNYSQQCHQQADLVQIL